MSVKRTLLIAAGLALVFAWSGERSECAGRVSRSRRRRSRTASALAAKNAGNNKQIRIAVGRERFRRRCPGPIRPPAPRAYRVLMFDPERQAAGRREPLGRLWHSSVGDTALPRASLPADR